MLTAGCVRVVRVELQEPACSYACLVQLLAVASRDTCHSPPHTHNVQRHFPLSPTHTYSTAWAACWQWVPSHAACPAPLHCAPSHSWHRAASAPAGEGAPLIPTCQCTCYCYCYLPYLWFVRAHRLQHLPCVLPSSNKPTPTRPPHSPQTAGTHSSARWSRQSPGQASLRSTLCPGQRCKHFTFPHPVDTPPTHIHTHTAGTRWCHRWSRQ